MHHLVLLSQLLFGPFHFTYDDYPNIEQTYLDFSIRPYIERPELSMKVVDTKNIASDIIFKPNIFAEIGLGVAWEDWGIAYGVPASSDPEQNPVEFGDTQYFDFQFYWNTSWIGLDAYLQDYDGFFLDNAADLAETNKKYSRLSITTVGLNAYYIFSDHFSLTAAFSQSEKQIRNGGSLLLMLSNTYLSVRTGQNLVTADEVNLHPEFSRFTRGDFFTISLLPGYGYTWKFYELSFSIVFFWGPGLQYQNYSLGEARERTVRPEWKGNIRSSLWYNWVHHYVGLYVLGDINRIVIGETRLEITSTTLQFFYGYRFYSI